MTTRHLPPEQLLAHATRALECASAAGAAHADACAEASRAFTVRVHGGTIETLKQSGTLGLGLRVIVGDAVGFASGTDLSPAGLEDLAHRAVALARFATPDSANGTPTRAEAGEDFVGDLELFDEHALELSPNAKIAMALELERIALGVDTRITRCDGSAVSSSGGSFAIANSNGIARAWEGTSVSAWVVALAEDGPKQQTGVYGMTKRHLADLPSMESLAREAGRRAVARIGARSVPSARVPVLMHPEIAASWISEMYEAFSGEAVLKKSSWLTDKLGEMVASPKFSLIDDGTRARGLGTSPYDGEGLRTRRNLLIDRGRCASFAYDHYHARRANSSPTGNGIRGFAGTPGIGFHNLFVENGSTSPQALLRQLDKGFYYDDQGSFGFNPVTGDYSYQAQGFWVEHGEKAFPVDGVTIAGNSLEMLRHIVAVGDDLEWKGSIACPTLLIESMTVSGA
ncbi:MAG: TldD/PmbA family protein [Candidatus Eisenbacteria bacterium]